MANIVIEVDHILAASISEASATYPAEFTVVSSDRFEGTDGVIQALVVLTASSIPIIAKIIIEGIRARRHVVIKKKGITVSGVSEETALRVLEQLSRED